MKNVIRTTLLAAASLLALGSTSAASAGTYLTLDSTIECPDTVVGQSKPCPVDGQSVGYGVWVKNTSTVTFRFQGQVFREGGAVQGDFNTVADGTGEYCYTKYRTVNMPLNARCRLARIDFHPTAAGERMLSVDAYLYVSGQNKWDRVLNLSANAGSPGTWASDSFGACIGGAGSWIPGDWTPQLGCGATLQSRTSTCAIGTNSGARSRAVRCVDGSGITQSDSFCNPSLKPTVAEACTPTDEAVCGEAPEGERTITLDNDCAPPVVEEPEEPGEDIPPPVTEEPPPAPTRPKGICVPDAALNKYCIMMPR